MLKSLIQDCGFIQTRDKTNLQLKLVPYRLSAPNLLEVCYLFSNNYGYFAVPPTIIVIAKMVHMSKGILLIMDFVNV